LTLRRIEGDGFGPKERAWNDPALLEHWRALWAEHVNRALEIAGDVARVDHRSLADQGIARVPQIHLGLAVTEMRRRGVATDRAELAGEIAAVNEAAAARARPEGSAAGAQSIRPGETSVRAAPLRSLFARAADSLTSWARLSPWRPRRPAVAFHLRL